MASIDILPRYDAATEGDLTVAIFADLHVGAESFAKELFERHVREVRDDPDQVAVLAGDLFQADLKSTKHGGVYRQTMDLDAACDYLCDILAPITGKVVALCDGNHDLRIYNSVGLSPVAQVAARLGLADRYARHGGIVHTRHGKAKTGGHRNGGSRPLDYFGQISHGTGNGANASSFERIGRIVEGCDWYASGHTHSPASSADMVFHLDRQHASVVERDRRYLVTGTYQAYDDYPKERRMMPRPLGRVKLWLSGSERRLEARI